MIPSLLKKKSKKIVYILRKCGIYGNIDRVLHEGAIFSASDVINISN